ncbi:Fe-S oxidoreductase [Candidatus Vecturithrix granuli]|uniref:Fe-S oxidoreductase n=1 Tax=Vecturithrix granuli TaxID=1499967 RepID=A0A081BTR7_VECG1|nr:Fe-S oxidoreductase [Candidatus Vecturithrix granuli]
MAQRISLIYPPTYDSAWGAIRPPIGLGYLSEMLQQQGIEHQILDMSLGYSLKQVLAKIAAFQPDLIGVSMTSLFHQSVYNIMQTIKQHFPNMPIVAGGPHISTMRAQALAECRAIDYGVTLEGDETIIELCQGKPPEQIKGVLYRTASHEIVYTGDREFILDLDRIPFPRYKQFELQKYVAREIGIITSRGCPYSCKFCPVKTTIGRTMRFRSAEHVIAELAYWHEKGYRDILILDDNFAMRSERVYAICDAIEQRGLHGFRFRCGNGIRADHVDYALLSRMYEVGFRFVSFGVESANEHILQTIKKGEHLEQIEQAVKDACVIGYDVTLFFILGLPGEGPQEVENSLRFAQKYPVFDAKFYNLIPFPNTAIYEWLTTQQYLLVSPEEYLNNASHWDTIPLFETPEFPREARIQILHKAHRIRKHIRKAAMQRKLKRFGVAGSLAASLFVHDWLQELLLHNRLIRRTAETTFRYIMK